MNIKGWKWRLGGVFLLVPLVLGGVAIVHAGDNESPMGESKPKASFLQRLMQRAFPMPSVKDREEAAKRKREAGKWLRERQEKRDEWLAEHALEVAGETLQQSIAALYAEGRPLPMDERAGLGSDETIFLRVFSSHSGTGVEASIYEFVYESLRMRHIIDLLTQSTKGEFDEGKALVEECIADYVGSAWRLRGEDYEWFNWMRAGVLPFLVFYFYEPLDGLDRLNKLFDALVYASTIDLKYGLTGNSMRAQGKTINVDENNNTTMHITSTEHHIFMYVMCAYIERIIADQKYRENEKIARILEKFAENRELGLQLRNEQRRELSMPDDQFIFLIPNPKLPSGFEIQFVKNYMRATPWFRLYHTGQLDYLQYMRDILRQLAEISSQAGNSQDAPTAAPSPCG